jgi:hypothetical protein
MIKYNNEKQEEMLKEMSEVLKDVTNYVFYSKQEVV